MIRLDEDQKLVYAGRVALRAPDGKPLSSVPQYMIVSSDQASSDGTVEVHANESLVVMGTLHPKIKSAKERFAEMKKGNKITSKTDAIPLYMKESVENINKKTHLSESEQKACDQLIGDLVAEFSRQVRKLKALRRQGREITSDI